MDGEWESDPDTHIGNENNTINIATISHRPSVQYLFMVNEDFRSGNSQGEGLNIFFYDDNENTRTANRFMVWDLWLIM